MKRYMLIGLAIIYLGVASPAMAANWTGLYFNGGAGPGIWSTNTNELLNGAPLFSNDQTRSGNGTLGTIGVGYDFQVNNNLVLGLMFDGEFTNLKGTLQVRGWSISGTTKENHAINAGARIGWLFNPDVLTYIEGGWSKAYFTNTVYYNFVGGTPAGVTTPSFNTVGWFAGLGMETQMLHNLYLRVEYRYAKYGKTDLSFGTAIPGESLAVKPSVQSGNLQLVYKFAQ